MSETKKPKTPVEAEATDEPGTDRTVEWGGDTWTVAVDGDGWPLDAGMAFSEIMNMEDDVTGLKAAKHVGVFMESVLGAAQWRKFTKAPGRRMADLTPFFNAVLTQAYGFQGLGESSASSD